MQVLKRGCFPACRGTRDALPESPNLLIRNRVYEQAPAGLLSLYAAISRAQRANEALTAPFPRISPIRHFSALRMPPSRGVGEYT